MTPAQIRLTLQELRTRTRPDQRSAYERALIALAELVEIGTLKELREAVEEPT
jgi:hypothetical protein